MCEDAKAIIVAVDYGKGEGKGKGMGVMTVVLEREPFHRCLSEVKRT